MLSPAVISPDCPQLDAKAISQPVWS